MESAIGAKRRKGSLGAAAILGRSGRARGTLAQPKAGGRAEFWRREENKYSNHQSKQKL